MVRHAARSLCLALVLAATLAAGPAAPYAPDTPEAGSVEAIAKFTTETKYGNPWVAYVPASDTVPSPTKYLGHVAGAAGELSRVAQIQGYFRELAKATPRVAVSVLGKSEEGRDILLAAIADEDGIRDLEKYRAATAALADPRKTTPEQAEAILATARPIYYFNAGLHSTETGSPEMVMELAYRLAVSQQPMIQQIRQNVIVLINPVSEPDGRDKAVDWFYRYLKGKTDYENLPEGSPPYWGYYVFHDNNRDTHQQALKLTQAVHRMFNEYHPTAVHDLHESIPLLHTWNGTGPYNGNLDPIVLAEWLETSFHEVQALTALGMPGVWTWGFGEQWGLHFLDSVANNHNSLGRGYETFGNHTAETVERKLRPTQRYVDKPVTDREWYRAWPPDKKFLWSLRNNTNYMESGCLSILDYTSKNAKDMLRNFYRKGYNSWQKGVKGKPYAFVIPEDQGDPRRVAQLVDVLRHQQIEVSRLTAPVTVAEGRFAKGAFVVRLDQPYRNYAVDLLEPQKFPETPYEPYDDVSWSLPVHYGVEAKRVDDAKISSAPLSPVTETVVVAGRVDGSGPVYLLKDTGQEALLAARFRLKDFSVSIAEKPFKSGAVDYPVGSWILAAQPGLGDALSSVAKELGLTFQSAAAAPSVAAHPSPIPRIAVWHLWSDTEATGWLRLALDQEKIPYAYIRDEEIRAGKLKDNYDVLLYGDNYDSWKLQVQGIDTKWGPMPYTKTAEFPSHGVPDASDDITGGIGWAGMANLQEYLNAGGLMITLGNGSALPLEGGLVRGVSTRGSGAYTPGVELKVKFARLEHPLSYGYPIQTSAFRTDLSTYSVRPADRRFMVLQWGTRPTKDERDFEEPADKTGKTDEMKEKEKDKEKADTALVVSGGGRNLDKLEGYPAILDVPAGKGRVLAFNFSPMHRDLNHSDYRFLWNGILNWSALPSSR
jgi:Zinc carboxypeptidase